jgi:hypothetical protein
VALCVRLLSLSLSRWARPAAGCLLAVSLLTVAPGAAGGEHHPLRPSLPYFWSVAHDVLDVGELQQRGEVANCGPTAAAMLLGHARPTLDPAALRDHIGLWSWDRFPLRAVSVLGRSPGMTSPGMMRAVLDAFGGHVRFRSLSHPFIPGEAYAMLALREALASGRPVLLMVESPVLWGTTQAGLHWIVVRGVEGDEFLFNDPSDGTQRMVTAERLWRAWRLHPLWRRLPGIEAFTAFVAERREPCDEGPIQLAAACLPEATGPRAE